MRALRQIAHDNPPSIAVLFGLVFLLVWYRVSDASGSWLVLYPSVTLFGAGLLWEAVWLFRRRSADRTPWAVPKGLRLGIDASLGAWFVLLAATFAVLFAPGQTPTLYGGLALVGLLGVYPVGLAGAMYLVSRHSVPREPEERRAGR